MKLCLDLSVGLKVPLLAQGCMRRKHTVGLAIRLIFHVLVARSIWSQAGTGGEEFVCARGRDSNRIVNSLVLILCEALLPICVPLGLVRRQRFKDQYKMGREFAFLLK